MQPATLSNPGPGSLAAVRDAAEGLLADARLLPDGWHVRDVRRVGDASVVLDLGVGAERGVLLEWHERGRDPIPAFLEGPRYAVGYRTGPNTWDLDDAETPEPLKRQMARACELLALPPVDVPLADPRVATGAGHREMAFTPDRFRSWLRDVLPAGTALADDWCLERVQPFEPGSISLLFRSAAGTMAPVQLDVRPAHPGQAAAAHAGSLDVLYRTPRGHRADGEREVLHAHLAQTLALRLEAGQGGLRWVDPPPAAGAAARRRAVDIRLHETRRQGGDPRPVEAIRDDMARALGAGARVLRFVGGDPLQHPAIRDLLRDARNGGVAALHVRTPARDLGNPKVTPQVLDALPPTAALEIQLHSADPIRHDDAAGFPGSLDAVEAAVTTLKPLLLERPGVSVALVTPLTPANVEELRAIASLARDLGVAWRPQLPDAPPLASIQRYREEALSMTDAVVAVYPQDAWALGALPLDDLRPCVALRHQARSGHPLWTPAIEQERVRALAAPAFAADGPTRQGCPSRESCQLAHACEGWVSEAYADEIGLQELHPVTEDELGSQP